MSKRFLESGGYGGWQYMVPEVGICNVKDLDETPLKGMKMTFQGIRAMAHDYLVRLTHFWK